MLIGSRTLTVETKDGPRSFAVRLFKPELSGTLYRCRYEIDWPEGRVESWAAGNDELHAIQLAMQKVAQDLYMSRPHHEGTMSWLKPWVGYGFPMPKNGRDLLVGHDKEFYG
jgi:hypothetical protein